MDNVLTQIQSLDRELEPFLNELGEIFCAFREQDSDCVSYGLRVGEQRWFVKHSDVPRGLVSLRRARHLHTTVQHPALPRLRHSFATPSGLALVYDWAPGTSLYAPSARRRDPESPYARFRALPAPSILDALDTIYDLHLLLADYGFVAVDFYDGCILYDFETARTFVIDLDEYRPGSFVLQADRLPGSRRFMAPEEWQRGARIDGVTNVYTLGRTAIELLASGSVENATWMRDGVDLSALRSVVVRATSERRKERHPTVRAFVEDWRAACAALKP